MAQLPPPGGVGQDIVRQRFFLAGQPVADVCAGAQQQRSRRHRQDIHPHSQYHKQSDFAQKNNSLDGTVSSFVEGVVL